MALPHLNSKFGANALDGVAHVHMLVNGHDVGAAASHALQKPPAAADVQNNLQLWVRLQQGIVLQTLGNRGTAASDLPVTAHVE